MQTISGPVVKWLQEKQQGDFEIHARSTVEMFAGKRWCFTTCALFMLCPRRSYVAASLPHEWLKSNNVPKSTNMHGKSFVPRLSLNAFTDKGSYSRLEETEPGFDFNDDEIKKLKIWPGGAIPYYIDQYSFDKVFRDRIRNFLDETNSVTGLNFLELPRPPGDDETRWVFFVNRQGLLSCIDHPFKNFTSEGVQKVLLGYDCLSNGGGLAEVVLALVGIPPQHNAPDRNKYIEIVKENILPGKANLFEILQDNEWLFHGLDYDFASAGHYNLHKYTVNGQATIKPLNTGQGIIFGEGKGFSYTDILKIRMIYNYISKKRLKSISMPDCIEIFNLGTNFSNHVHVSENDVQPRKKPNKYLELPDEVKDSSTDNRENINKTEINTTNADKKITKEENSVESNSKKGQDIENEDQEPDKSNEKLNHKEVNESKEESTNSVEKLNENVTNEKSPAQSDSKSDYEDKPQELKFIKPGFNG